MLEARYASAVNEAQATEEAYQAALRTISKSILDQLLQKSLEDRFEALEKYGDELSRPDRRRLVRSIRDRQPAKIVISTGTSSWQERWRAKLPYKTFQIVSSVLMLLISVALAVVGYENTPQELVKLNIATEQSVVGFRLSGRQMEVSASPKDKFALMQVVDEMAILRSWVKGQGYITIYVPVSAILRE